MAEPLPFDQACAQAFGRVHATARAARHSSRRRLADLLIVATAVAHDLPLATRNPADLRGREELVEVIAL